MILLKVEIELEVSYERFYIHTYIQYIYGIETRSLYAVYYIQTWLLPPYSRTESFMFETGNLDFKPESHEESFVVVVRTQAVAISRLDLLDLLDPQGDDGCSWVVVPDLDQDDHHLHQSYPSATIPCWGCVEVEAILGEKRVMKG